MTDVKWIAVALLDSQAFDPNKSPALCLDERLWHAGWAARTKVEEKDTRVLVWLSSPSPATPTAREIAVVIRREFGNAGAFRRRVSIRITVIGPVARDDWVAGVRTEPRTFAGPGYSPKHDGLTGDGERRYEETWRPRAVELDELLPWEPEDHAYEGYDGGQAREIIAVETGQLDDSDEDADG